METVPISLGVVVFLVFVALVFDFMNGFHDAANSIATVVSTRVLKPYWAVVWAAFFNFVALFVFELKVAGTVGTGIVDSAIVDHHVVFGALTGRSPGMSSRGTSASLRVLRTLWSGALLALRSPRRGPGR